MIILDCEVTRWFSRGDTRSRADQLADLPFGIAVTYDTKTGAYSEWKKQDIYSLWCYLLTDVVCGWNIADFDLLIIRQSIPPAYIVPPKQPIVYDLFAEIRSKTLRFYGLWLIAEHNLPNTKSITGQEVAACLAEYEALDNKELLRKAFDACRNDVELELALYLKLETGGELYLPPVADQKRGIYFGKGGIIRFAEEEPVA